MFRKAYLKHKTPDTNNLPMRRWHFCETFDVTTMMAGKNQAALAVCAQTKVIFPFKRSKYLQILMENTEYSYIKDIFEK